VSDRQLHLALNLHSFGTHPGGWRLPTSDPRGPIDVDHYKQIARISERGLLDAIFFADVLAAGGDPSSDLGWLLDPALITAAIADATEEIGFVISSSTTYGDPYTVARTFASLDHITGGRVGWNVVTGYDERSAGNFGDPQLPPKELRYRRAGEFVDVVVDLWESWEEGALVGDQERGLLIDRNRVHAIDHVGEFFSVKGPLQVPRPPQGRPVLFQAGGSPAGRDLAARTGDGIFSAQMELEDAIAYRDDIRVRAARHGRQPDDVAVLPGVVVVVGSTDEEAHRIKDELDAITGGPERQLEQFAGFVGVDPDRLSLDAPVPAGLIAGAASVPQGFRDALQSVLDRPDQTLREVLGRGLGHRLLVGGPETIADDFEAWLLAGAADGFNIMSESYPAGLERFVDHVVPLLQERGIYRRSYDGPLLRRRFGR
jgi:FMN-dependent oxidoreductase (nitrilotriacetate monooxygenase family)